MSVPSLVPAAEPSPRERVERVRQLVGRTPAYWRGAVAIAVVVTGAGLANIVRIPRVYESETVVLVREAMRTDTRDDVQSVREMRLGPKLKDRLLARSRLEKIVTELALFSALIERRGMIDAVEEMRTHIGFRSRDSDTFVITYQAGDRALAQQVAQRLADSMVEEFVRENTARTNAARDFLLEEERHAEEDLNQKETELASFLTLNPQFSWDPARGPAPLSAQAAKAPAGAGIPATADMVLRGLYNQKTALEARLAPAGSRVAPAPEGLVDLERAVAKARADDASAQADLASKRQKYTEDHPDVIASRTTAVVAARARSDAEAALSAAKAAATPPPAPPEDEAAAEDLRKKLAELKATIVARERGAAGRATAEPTASAHPAGSAPAERPRSLGAPQAEFDRLVRTVTEARHHKQDITDRRGRAELSASAAATSGTMQMEVLDRAFLPTRPIRPNRTLLATVTGLVGGLLGALYAFARVFGNDVIYSVLDVAMSGGPAVLAVLRARGARARAAPQATSSALVGAPRRTSGAMYSAPPPAARSTGAMYSAPPPAVRPASAAYSAPPPAARPHASIIPPAPGASDEVPLTDAPLVLARSLPPPVIEMVDATLLESAAWEAPSVSAREADVDWPKLDDALLGPTELPALRALRHQVERRALQGHMVVAVTSALAGEGKTRLAAQLALVLAESQRARVLLVEANLERPGLASLLGVRVDANHGFSAQLERRRRAGTRTGWQVQSRGDALHLLIESTDDDRPGSLLHSREFAVAIEEFRSRYDYVVIDGPAVLEAGDATSVEAVSDGVLLVARAGFSRASKLREAAAALGDRRLLGAVLSDVAEPG